MERRVLLAIFLCFLVLYVWNALFVKPLPKTGAATTTKTAAPASAAPQAEALQGGETAARAVPKTPPPPNVALGDQTEHDTRVETRDVIAVFTNKGARLKS